MKKSIFFCAALFACALGFQSCDKVDNPSGEPLEPTKAVIDNGTELADAVKNFAKDGVLEVPSSVVELNVSESIDLSEIEVKAENLTLLAAKGIEIKIGKPMTNVSIVGDAAEPAKIIANAGFVVSNNFALGNVIIDASSLTGENKQLIVLNGTKEYVTRPDGTKDDSHLLIDVVDLQGVTITGMPDGLIRDNQKTLLKNLTINNCNIKAPNKVFINFQSKGYVETVTVKNSTIWSTDNAQFFIQYGSRLKNITGAEAAGWLQTIDVQNSTFYHIAYNKNVCDFPMNSQKCNVYTLKNNILVDCGKSGQTAVGFNKGGVSANPVWTVDGNNFVYGGENKNDAEISKAGQKNGEDIVKNCVAGVPTFADAANGDFTQSDVKTGDPRWTK